MGYTNSSMVAYKKLSPNHSGQRTHSIDRITPHCARLSQFSDKLAYPRRIIISEVISNPLIS